jgi:hypothetical protein
VVGDNVEIRRKREMIEYPKHEGIVEIDVITELE